jgi:hypothetical protein
MTFETEALARQGDRASEAAVIAALLPRLDDGQGGASGGGIH